MGGQWHEAIRRRRAAEARRTYARLLVEHERVRRLVAQGGSAARPCAPGQMPWRTLAEVAMFEGVGRRRALTEFCGRFHEKVCSAGFSPPPPPSPFTGRAGVGASSPPPNPPVVGGREERPEGRTTNGEERLRPEGRTTNEEAPGRERAEEPPRAVPPAGYLDALRAALELVADGIVRNGGERPWGKGQPRAPRSAEAFEAVCRELRDSDSDADEFGSLAAILDGAEALPATEEAGAAHRVAFDVPGKALHLDDWRIALPEGREYAFLRALVARREAGEVTPVIERRFNWKNAVDQLRQRIRKATGRGLLGQVVVTAKGAPGGYRLHPGVEVLHDREVRWMTLDEAALEGAGRRPRRKPKGRDLREGEEED